MKQKHKIDEVKRRGNIKVAKYQKLSKQKKLPLKEFDEVLRKNIPITKRQAKAKERYKLVHKFNPKALDSIKTQKREETRQRQVLHRYK